MLRIGGIASGLDTNQIIADLMRAERIPLDRIQQDRIFLDWQRDAYREVNLSISKFRDNFEKLRLQGTFNSYAATSSNTNVANATATSSAVPGTYNLDVISLAKVATARSEQAITKDVGGVPTQVKSTDKILGAGETASFKIKNGAGLETTITIDDQVTYGDLASKIGNAVDVDGKSLGFRANFDDTTGRFFISTKELGGDQQINFEEVTGDFVKNNILNDATLSGVSGSVYSFQGTYGEINFDGVQVNNLKSNTVTVNGIQLSLLQEGQSSTISVQSDISKNFDLIKGFVESYNELVNELEGKLTERRYRDYRPLTNEQRDGLSEREAEQWDEKAKSGLLRNDKLIRNVLSELRTSFSNPVEGIPSGEISALSEIGIKTGDYRLGGQLFIDEDKLKNALQNKPDEVMNLFTRKASDTEATSYQGLGFRLQGVTSTAITSLRKQAGSTNGIGLDTSSLGKNIQRIDDRISRFQSRLTQVEDRYWRQFTAMEKAMNELNNQSAFIMNNMFNGIGQNGG
jgi:flagellar hook-associated protein 2